MWKVAVERRKLRNALGQFAGAIAAIAILALVPGLKASLAEVAMVGVLILGVFAVRALIDLLAATVAVARAGAPARPHAAAPSAADRAADCPSGAASRGRAPSELPPGRRLT